jgi:glycosyltransferase involved in cell wall biosynthesis
LKYWLLTTEYPPAHGGGISTYCRCTAEMLAAREISVTVIVCDDGVDDYLLESFNKNLLIVRFNAARRGVPKGLGGSARLSYGYFKLLQVLADELGVPDIIESQDYLGIAYYLQQFNLLGYAPFAGIPVVITMHAPAFVYLPYNRVPLYKFPDFWTGEMEKQSIRAADRVISPSQFLIGEVGKHINYGPRKPDFLPYGYEPCQSGHGAAGVSVEPVLAVGSIPAPEPGGWTTIKPNKIVYYGKLSPQKGSFELLEYFQGLWDEGFPHALHVIGGTDIVFQPEQATMGQIVRRSYDEYIRRGLLVLHNKVAPERIPDALADAHVVVFPSIVDNLPFACLEALGCGKIVLASVQGGQREIIQDGINGFLFDHAIAGDFSRKLLGILDLEPGQAEQVMTNARTSLERYSYGNIAPRKIAVLEQVIREYEPSRNFPFLWQEPIAEPVEDTGIDALLSVVIPFYNLGNYLHDCIASVLASTYRRLEIIVINDGSTDSGSLAMLDRWREHPDVTVIDQSNRGLAVTRNRGARRAAGRFLAFLDADDQVTPDYYEKAIGILNWYENVHFVGCWVKYFGGATGTWPAFTPGPPYLLAHNPINSSGLVYKTASFLVSGLNDRRLEYGLEDYESVVSMVSQGYSGVVLPESLHLYRVRPGSMIRRMNQAKLLYSHNYIAEKHRAYYQRFSLELIQLLNSNGPGYLYENPTIETFVRSSWNKPGSWRERLKSLVRRNKTLKILALAILKKTEHLWQKQ